MTREGEVEGIDDHRIREDGSVVLSAVVSR